MLIGTTAHYFVTFHICLTQQATSFKLVHVKNSISELTAYCVYGRYGARLDVSERNATETRYEFQIISVTRLINRLLFT